MASTTLTVEDRHILWRHPLQLSSIKQSRQTGDKKVILKFFTSTNSFSHSARKLVDQRSIDLWELHMIPFFSYYFLLPFKPKPRKVPFSFLSSSLLFGHLLMRRVMTSLTQFIWARLGFFDLAMQNCGLLSNT